MKNFIFNLVWSGFLAWCLTKFMIMVELKTGFGDMFCFPEIIAFIHGLDLSVKMLFFLSSTIVLMLGIAKWLGNALLVAIGIMMWIVLISLGLFLVYHIANWVVGTL